MEETGFRPIATGSLAELEARLEQLRDDCFEAGHHHRHGQPEDDAEAEACRIAIINADHDVRRKIVNPHVGQSPTAGSWVVSLVLVMIVVGVIAMLV